MILDANSFAGLFPEHNYETFKWLQGLGHNDAPAPSCANVSIAVEGAVDIVLTEPGLSTIVHTMRCSYHLPAYAQLLHLRSQ